MKRDIFIDTLNAGASQTLSIALINDPRKAIAAVTITALVSGMTKALISRRRSEIESLANELCDPKTTKMIKKMGEKQFFDDLAYSIDKILGQRTDSKRVLMKNVFLGYIRADHKTAYPLEKMYKVVENLTLADVAFFQKVFKAIEFKNNYSVSLPWISKKIMDDHTVPPEAQEKMIVLNYTDNPQEQQSRDNLINEGLLVERNQGIGTWGGGGGDPQIYITAFGQYFKDYLLGIDDL